MKNNLLVGIDIGTQKICTVIGHVNTEEGGEELEIIGYGVVESRGGIRKGNIVDMNRTVEDIRKSVKEAELTAGVEVESAYVNISGSHVETRCGKGSVNVTGRGGEITQEDVDRAITHGSSMLLPQDRDTIHVLPQEYFVDTQEDIKNPVGMAGAKLDVNVVVVTTTKASIQNLLICMKKAGINVLRVMLSHIAAGEGVLTQDEKELGVVLVDIGKGVTDVAVFEKGALSFARAIPVGGYNFTNDLAIGIRTPFDKAEKIKRRYGCAMDPAFQNQNVEVPNVGGRKQKLISVTLLSDILRPRAQEIFEFIKAELMENGLENRINAGIVLTGGSSQLAGLLEIADEIFAVPIRIGVPDGVGGLIDKVGTPEFSTAVGLLKCGYDDMRMRGILQARPKGLLRRFIQWAGF